MTILNDDDSAGAELKRTMDVNFMGAVYCTREAYKSMTKRDVHGYIININSIDGHYVSHAQILAGLCFHWIVKIFWWFCCHIEEQLTFQFDWKQN